VIDAFGTEHFSLKTIEASYQTAAVVPYQTPVGGDEIILRVDKSLATLSLGYSIDGGKNALMLF